MKDLGAVRQPPVTCGSRFGLVTWMALFMAFVMGCSAPDFEVTAEPSTDPRFDGSTETLEGLGRTVMDALISADTVTLASVRLTEEEHNGVVWPELPASRPEVNFPLDFAWSNIELRDRRSMARLLPVFHELEARFRAVQCRGEAQDFESFRVLTDCWILFDVEGREGPFEAQLFKDVVVRGGGHKIFRFYDQPPRRYDPARAD